ncbi:MAG: ParB/RepB/Spo0J family partition protein [Candidatus Scalindua rubra]|uniref:Chromosome partitioning protein n=1 Tax=Candidatus Scalindua brodae TaxID=237368 RepID=A0A0B0EQF2_9BACT|nr:MAG: chromosome partitioning protein [Candidatus Scalindua brodae]MBZ0110493.1 ParB/RepB/Spo0J family partition protein [Candidatus Scalindua rubra]TWU36329.1 Chromosome-partitioning protein Spo0J [Candidatus Brocadiaceae bacterium S225]
MSNKENLGRGLESLLGDAIGIEASEKIMRINLTDIQPNEAQPRKEFAQSQMETLISSIQEHGILQPIIVRPTSKGYKIIAGERRWRAATQLGLKAIPTIVKTADSLKTIELALVENIQREDLNPMEKATAFSELKINFGLTQEQIATKVGQDRSTIANTIRLLDLPKEVQDLVSRGTISMGHARSLLSLKDQEKQIALGERIAADGLSVRDVELIVSDRKDPLPSMEEASGSRPTPLTTRSPHILDLEDGLRKIVGTKVSIVEKNGKGRITIEFANNSQFENIVDKLKAMMKHAPDGSHK